MLALLIAPVLFAPVLKNPKIKTSICALGRDPGRYANKMVRVRAFISGDLLHGTDLVDAACDNVGISFDYDNYPGRPINVIKDKSYKRLSDLWPHFIELRDKGVRIYGTFEGLYQWSEAESSTGHFTLYRVHDIYVGRIDDPRFAARRKATASCSGRFASIQTDNTRAR